MKSPINILIIFCALVCPKIFGHSWEGEFPVEHDSNIQLPPDPASINKVVPEPYASLGNLLLNMGTSVFRKANQDNLERFIKTYKPKTIIELGAFLGVSAIFMASLMPQDGKLYAVDNWSWHGLPYYSDGNQQNIGDKAVKTYEQFLSNVKYYNLTDIIIPIFLDTIEASHKLNVIADLIYVDADHSENAVYNDIMHWYPKLSKTGIMCGDDWGYESVKRAVTRAANELGKEIKTDHNFWYFVF